MWFQNLFLFSLIFHNIIDFILLGWNFFFPLLEQHEFYSPYSGQEKVKTSARNDLSISRNA